MAPTKAKTQSGSFAAAARAAECDEDEKAFEARLKKVAKANPAPSKAAAKK